MENLISSFGQLIVNFELSRLGTRAYVDGLLAGCVIGLPPVLNFGSPELQAKVVPEVLSGKKYICLAISEAFAGSDVGGLQTTAVRDGDYWVVTGTKKYDKLVLTRSYCVEISCELGGSQTEPSPITSPLDAKPRYDRHF